MIAAGDSTVRGLVIDGGASAYAFAIQIATEGGDRIEGDFLGPDPAGTVDVGAPGIGVEIVNTPDNTIGGTTPEACNLLSVAGQVAGGGNLGVYVHGEGATGNLVQGNFVGTNAAGTSALGEGSSVLLEDAPNNTIGGTTPGARNVISCNSAASGAVEIRGAGATGNLVQGNFIGIDVTGTTALSGAADDGYGVFVVNASGNTIGGTASGARNVISGLDLGTGLVLATTTGANSNNLIQGNFIGTDADGLAAVPDEDGVEIYGFSSDNTIGGTTPQARNIISGNTGYGFEDVPDPSVVPVRNVVQGNFIGVNAVGAPLGNGSDGVVLTGGNTLGGTAAGAGNVIADNGGTGVFVPGRNDDPAGYDNAILSNAIFGNGGLGINLAENLTDGPTPNDPGDADDGPNRLQNFPVITSVTSSGGSTTIAGTLNSTPGESFLIQFFSNDAPNSSSFGEGQMYIGSIQTDPTDADTGDVSFTATLPVAVSPTQFITATATDTDGNTSEFSEIDADLAINQVASAAAAAVGQDVTFTATVTNAGPFAAPGLLLADALPAGFDFVSATGGVTPQDGVLHIALDTLPVGSSTTAMVVLRATAAGGPFTNSMSVRSAVDDHHPADNTFDATVNVSQSPTADVSVQLGAAPDTVEIGQELTYTITATNLGSTSATGVALNDRLPAGADFVSATGGATPSDGTLSVALGTLEAGASSTVTVVVRPTADGTLTDGATVSDDPPDTDASDKTAMATTTVAAPAAADLSVGLAATPDPVGAGQDLTYTLTVTNVGTAVATGATLTDNLPSGTTFVSATGGVAPVESVLTFALGDLAAGAHSSVTIVVIPTVAGTLGNVAAAGMVETDPTPADNSATVSTTVTAAPGRPDLALTGVSPDSVTLGSSVTDTLTVTNRSTAEATGVVLTVTLPPGVTFVSATGGVTPDGDVLTFAIGNLAAGAHASVMIVVTPTAVGAVADIATTLQDPADPIPVDNVLSLPTAVAPTGGTQGSPPATSSAPAGVPARPRPHRRRAPRSCPSIGSASTRSPRSSS